MTPIYYWIHHTAGHDGNTGVQRVVRGLAAGLLGAGHEIVPVSWCAEREAVIRAEPALCTSFRRFGGADLPTNLEPDCPLHLASADRDRLAGALLLLPEVPHVAGDEAPVPAVVLDYARYYGMRSACIFYDLIPLRFPGYEPMVPAHAAYAHALIGADLIIPISRSAGEDLAAWWEEQGYLSGQTPPIRPVLLPHEILGTARGDAGEEPELAPIRFLAVGTVEPRKNQVALLEAFARLRRRRPDLDIELDVVGGIHPAVAAQVHGHALVEPRIRLHHFLDDDALLALIRDCHATVFISLAEGFGLPIAESLWHGRPCLCSNFGSMAEIAEGGGCLPIDSRVGQEIERGLERLATDKVLRDTLAREAHGRQLTRWLDYANQIIDTASQATVVRAVTVIEGSNGSADLITEDLSAHSIFANRLRWHSANRALLPATAAIEWSGGRLSGQWGVIARATCADAAEHDAVVAEARGLGFQVVSRAGEAACEHATAMAAPVAADIVLLPDARTRDMVQHAAQRTLVKTVNLGRRVRNGSLVELLAHEQPPLATLRRLRPPARIFYWVGLTVTQPFNTGIQRVARALAAALAASGVELTLVKWDRASDSMVPVSQAEADHFGLWGGPRLASPGDLPIPTADDWLIVPEITIPVVPHGSNVARLARRYGLRIAAIFYDLIPDKQPEFYPKEALDQLAHYWAMFAEVDIALPISWTVAADLRRHLSGRGLRVPEIIPCPLAGEIPGARRNRRRHPATEPNQPLMLLAVGTWEPRKNYPRVLRAVAAASHRATRPIRLTIVGRRDGRQALDAEIERLATILEHVTLRDHVTDAEMIDLYHDAQATIYGSWEEGFGLPVVESLWRGAPCVCHDGSAMVETIPGGGVLAIDMLDEAAIAEAIIRLADDPDLLAKLTREAASRPIRTWAEYARDVSRALAQTAASPGWPLPMIARRRPLLTCAITTYNRAPWLRHSLAKLLEATRPWRDVVEVVVCDNASTDETPGVVAKFVGEANFVARRNLVNVGMLGNLGATARATNGAFVWLLGDDDLIVDHAIEDVLDGLAAHPDVEMAYMNYGYTRFDDPARLADRDTVIREAVPIAPGGPNRRVDQLREVAGLNENLFTAIYACAFRRDHALRAYQQDVSGQPFSSLLTCVPSSVYALRALAGRPAWWVGEPAVVVNMNVSWLRWALLWHLERMPDLYDMAEWAGVDPVALDRYRWNHCQQAAVWARMAYFEAEDAIRQGFSMQRLLERCKHLEPFRATQLPKLREVYAEAWTAGRVIADDLPPDRMFAAYGLDY